MDIVPQNTGSLAERCYRILLTCYPRRFRADAERELLECFRAARALRSFLFGVSPLDPVTYGGLAILFAGVAALACLVPVRRALRTEPLEVLCHD